jgi:hypothetical protein
VTVLLFSWLWQNIQQNNLREGEFRLSVHHSGESMAAEKKEKKKKSHPVALRLQSKSRKTFMLVLSFPPFI